MVESVIMLLIYICLVVAVVYLVFWVLAQLNVPIPAQVTKIVWVIVALVCLLLVYKMLAPVLRLPSLINVFT